MKRYYLFGLQRSGTNFIESLLEQLYPNSILNTDGRPLYMWKHTYNEEPSTNDPIVYVLKHPNKWLESINRNPIDLELHTQKDLQKLWEEHTNFWASRATYILKYEDVIRDTETYFGPVTRPTNLFMNTVWTEDRQKEALEGLTPHSFYDNLKSTPLW